LSELGAVYVVPGKKLKRQRVGLATIQSITQAGGEDFSVGERLFDERKIRSEIAIARRMEKAFQREKFYPEPLMSMITILDAALMVSCAAI